MSENKKDEKKKNKSGAGKGDKPRRGISQEEWGDKWEKIFRPTSDKKRDSIQMVRKRKRPDKSWRENLIFKNPPFEE